MNYFILENTAEPSITGSYPQLELVDYSYSYVRKLQDMDSNKFMNLTEGLAEFKFTKGAIKTSALTCTVIKAEGLVVSEKFKKLIEKLVQEGIKTTPFQFVPLSIKNSIEKYYFLQFIPDPNIIDYNETTFVNLVGDGSEEKIKNHQSYDPFLELKKITLKESLHIFMIPYDNKILISERVKEEIEKNNITGISEVYSARPYIIN